MVVETRDGLAAPRPLPRALADPVPVVIAGQVLWAVAWVTLTVVGRVHQWDPGVWPSVCGCGFALGFLGLAVIAWQRRTALSRAASRRSDQR